jgi:hypothetical protein
MLQQKLSRKERELSRAPWPFSAAASLVNRLARLEREKGKQTADSYGLKCSASFAKLDPAGLWRKTCGGFSQLTLDGHSEEYSETWPKMGIVLDGYAMALEMLGHRIEGKGCLSWGTPRATQAVRSERFGKGRLPTPEEYVANPEMWPTPHSTCSTGPGKQGRQGGENLQTAVMWPTPKSRDWKSPHGKAGMERKTPDLNVMTQQGKGQLNPAWVALLMGFPPGWLDIDGPPGQGHSIPGNRRGLQPG